MWSEALTGYFKGNRYKIPGAGWPVGAVDPAYINPRWIPLTRDGTGNHIGLDLDPWPRGRIGQIILFGRDEAVKVVLAELLGKFLEWIADLLESGNVRFDAYEGVQQFYLKTPRCNHFHDGARILLGAPDPFLGLEDQFTYTLAARAARGEVVDGSHSMTF